jgi:predicted transcriptional regulator of viral defense system
MQRFSETDTAVIAKAQRLRRSVLSVKDDGDWLAEFSSRRKNLLLDMAERGALIPVGAGRYALAAVGTTSTAQLAFQPLLDARLSRHGAYYLGFLSALEEHRLTDVSTGGVATVAVGFNHTQLKVGQIEIAGRRVLAAASRLDIFKTDGGIETVRVSRSERYRRSNPARTLVDCLWHPELCGATETWVTAWGRASLTPDFDPEEITRHAETIGGAIPRRVGFMLELVGRKDEARRLIAARHRRADRPTRLVADVDEDGELDPFWHVYLNISADRLEGWASYGK